MSGNSYRQRRKSFLSAATARVEFLEIYERLKVLEGPLANSIIVKPEEEPSDCKTCEYDLSKSVLDYLPTPIVRDSSDDSNSALSSSRDLNSVKFDLVSQKKFLGVSQDLATGINDAKEADMDPEFDSMFSPTDMRMLALVSHNNMKHSMKEFVKANKNILKKFRLTGTNTTMTMLEEAFGDDPGVQYGPSCKSGPLGGDAQLVAMAVTGELGGCIFFIDPMDAHPHSADIECLVRQGNVHNILMMNNPTTAHVCLNALRVSLKMGRIEIFPSFFFDLESPSVAAYKIRQSEVLKATADRNAISAREEQIRMSMNKASKMHQRYRASLEEVDGTYDYDCLQEENEGEGENNEEIPFAEEEKKEDFLPSKDKKEKKTTMVKRLKKKLSGYF